MIAYAVTRRTREIGIRLALGAQPGDVIAMILREGLFLTTIGSAIGVMLVAAVAPASGQGFPSAFHQSIRSRS